jgi:hypothetical protein
VNTLRLWAARATRDYDRFFNEGGLQPMAVDLALVRSEP